MESFGNNIDLFNVLSEIQLEFLWHTALRASEDHVQGVSYGRRLWCMEDLLPQMYMTADLRIGNDSLHLNQPMRELYGTSHFRDSKLAKHL